MHFQHCRNLRTLRIDVHNMGISLSLSGYGDYFGEYPLYNKVCTPVLAFPRTLMLSFLDDLEILHILTAFVKSKGTCNKNKQNKKFIHKFLIYSSNYASHNITFFCHQIYHYPYFNFLSLHITYPKKFVLVDGPHNFVFMFYYVNNASGLSRHGFKCYYKNLKMVVLLY